MQHMLHDMPQGVFNDYNMPHMRQMATVVASAGPTSGATPAMKLELLPGRQEDFPSAPAEAAESSARIVAKWTQEGVGCWGALLKSDTTCCSPGFLVGKGHLKNKFCSVCQEGIRVPTSRVRIWTPELKLVLSNDHREVRKASFQDSPTPFLAGEKGSPPR